MDSKTRHKVIWAVFFAVIFSALLLYIVDWNHFSLIAARADLSSLVFAFLLLLTSNCIRAIRFRTLDYDGNKLGHWLIINKLYNFMTATLPGGVGDAATAYLMKRYSLLGMLRAFRILILSRIMDIGGMSALLLVVAVFIGSDVQYRETSAWISAVLVIISVAAIVPATEHFMLNVLKKLPGQNRVLTRIRDKLNDLAELSGEHKRRGAILLTMVQTMGSITATAFSMHFILLSYGSEFTILQSFYCVAVYAIFQMIPIQGFAGIGTQPARWLVALTVAGYNGPDAAALSIVLHATFYMFIAIMGLSAMLIWVMMRKT